MTDGTGVKIVDGKALMAVDMDPEDMRSIQDVVMDTGCKMYEYGLEPVVIKLKPLLYHKLVKEISGHLSLGSGLGVSKEGQGLVMYLPWGPANVLPCKGQDKDIMVEADYEQ